MKTDHEIASTQANGAAGSSTSTATVASKPESSKAKTNRSTKPIKGLKLPKQPRPTTATVETSEDDTHPADRLPTSLKELSETKGGFVATLFLGGKEKDDIALELKAAFKLSDEQAVKITRRITGRVRLYQRIFEIVPVKK